MSGGAAVPHCDGVLLGKTVHTAAVSVTDISLPHVIRETVIPLTVFINIFSEYLHSNPNYYL
jgi:hypothetical protein